MWDWRTEKGRRGQEELCRNATKKWTRMFIWTLKAPESCRQFLFKLNPANWSSTSLCNVGKQTHGFQKQSNDCFKEEKCLSWGSWHLSFWLPRLVMNLNTQANITGGFFTALQADTWILLGFFSFFEVCKSKTGDRSENCLCLPTPDLRCYISIQHKSIKDFVMRFFNLKFNGFQETCSLYSQQIILINTIQYNYCHSGKESCCTWTCC